MNSNTVKYHVESFRKKMACDSLEDSFPAWYLNFVCSLPETTALRNSSDTSEYGGKKNYDFGIDAFHLNLCDDLNILSIIQAKYSTSPGYISKGFRDLIGSLQLLNSMLEKLDTDVPFQNKVLVNLKSTLNQLDSDVLQNLQIEFIVIHLSDEDETILAYKTESSRKALMEELEYKLPNHKCKIKIEGPRDWGNITQVIPAEWTSLRMKGFTEIEHSNQMNHKMYLGVGFISDIVEIYKQRRDNLFAKNVRYFIKSRKNIEKGPSAKMRDTLKEISIQKKEAPEIFAFYHNGITIFGREVQPEGNDLKIREPYVLNGCQTIKTSFLFRYDPKYSSKINEENWNNIVIPVRIITSQNENLIRQITINNNRQNSMSAAALRANDPVQLELENRFREKKIFYERQEGAKNNLEDTNPEIFDKLYEYSNNLSVNIVDLARSIAAAAGEVSYSLSPSHIFEYDNLYNKIFNEKRLKSISFLIFLQNLNEVIPVVLKKHLSLYENEYGISRNRLVFFTMALFIKYIEKSKDLSLIYCYGDQLVGKNKNFRADVAKELGNHKSKIQMLLNEYFLKQDNNRTETLVLAFEKAGKYFKSNNNIFEMVENVDAEMSEMLDEPY